MKKIISLLLTTFLLVSADVEVSDINYKSKDRFLNEDYVLNGVGIREKWFLDIYTIGLYLKDKSKDGYFILNSDANKFVRIVIVSGLITAERFHDGLDDGFEKSTQGNTEPINDEILKVREAFGSDFKIGDEFIIFFNKSGETVIYKAGKETKTISPNKDFQKALLGMWIGKYPVLKGLKDELLGTD